MVRSRLVDLSLVSLHFLALGLEEKEKGADEDCSYDRKEVLLLF